MRKLLDRSWARQLLALALLLALWEIAARMGRIDPFYAPAPSRIATVLWGVFADGSIWDHLEATFTAAILGLLAGLAIGILLGFLAALVPVLADLLEPVMILLNAIPRVILAPLFVIWLGIELGSKIMLALVLVAVLVFFAVYGGIRDVDRRLIERVRTLAIAVTELERTTDTRALEETESQIARLEAEANPLDRQASEERVRRLALLKRQRRALAAQDRRRSEAAGKLDSCVLALGNMRLDVLRLRAGNIANSMDQITTLTERARSLAEEVDAAVYAADEIGIALATPRAARKG